MHVQFARKVRHVLRATDHAQTDECALARAEPVFQETREGEWWWRYNSGESTHSCSGVGVGAGFAFAFALWCRLIGGHTGGVGARGFALAPAADDGPAAAALLRLRTFCDGNER